MKDSDDIAMVQDTSTQAMTEVVLGLSMAFFALLIIALMSVTLPPSVDISNQTESTKENAQIDISDQVNLLIQNTPKSPKSSEVGQSSDEVILLYWGGQFFDTQQKIVNVDNVLTQQNVIVAVNPQIPFSQLIDIQTKFSNKTLRLTKLNEQWQQALSEVSLSEQSVPNYTNVL